MALGDRIRENRKRAGLSQDKVAELVGVSRQAVTKWEQGRSAPNTENLFRLAEVLGTTVDLLVRETGPEAGELCRAFRREEERLRREKRQAVRGNLYFALAVLAGFAVLFVALQLVLGRWEEASVMGMLLSGQSRSYLWGWMVHHRAVWLCCAVSVLAAALGKRQFAVTTAVMFFLGILVGELFGPYPAGAAWGHDHYGWFIWLVCYGAALVVGAVTEKRKERGTAQQRLLRWLAAMAGSCVGAVVLVFLLR